MVKILDASAVLSYLWKEPGSEKVKDLFIRAAAGSKNLLMTTVNAGEVYYIIMKEGGLEEAEKIFAIIKTFPIEFVPVDLVIAQQAAQYKAAKNLPFVDCFAAALAKLNKGELVTKDKDFKAVEGDVKILWV